MTDPEANDPAGTPAEPGTSPAVPADAPGLPRGVSVGAPGTSLGVPADTPGTRADAGSGLRLRDPAHHVSPKAKTLWRLSAVLGWLPLMIGLGVWMFLDPAHRSAQIWVLIGLVVVVALHATIMPIWRYRVHRWEVNDLAVYTQTGWIHQERQLAPISRIQTVDSEFGPLERMFGLGSVKVTTASAAGAQKVSGLERDVVERIVSDLTVTAAVSESDAT